MKKIFSSEIVLLLVLMLLATFMVLLTYFYNFHIFPMSKQTSDWGNFGSYVNGILSPILLFFTLIYIARSLKAQKDAQSTQKEDLLAQMELVKIANKNQQLQIKELEKATKINQIMNHKSEIIKFMYGAIDSFKELNSDLDSRWDEISKKSMIDDNEVKMLESISKQKINSFNRILNLNNLALYLILEDFDTVDDLKERFKSRWEHILKEFQ